MVSLIYPLELTLLQTNTSDVDASFRDLFLTIIKELSLPEYTINVIIAILKSRATSHRTVFTFLKLNITSDFYFLPRDFSITSYAVPLQTVSIDTAILW